MVACQAGTIKRNARRVTSPLAAVAVPSALAFLRHRKTFGSSRPMHLAGRHTRLNGMSERMSSVQSPIIPIVRELIEQHPGTISLGQGVVHYPPPPEVQQGIAEFMTTLRSHLYGPVGGIAPLIELIEAKLRDENQIIVRPSSRVIVTAGANMGFLNAILAVCDPGDEVILLSPYYFNHEMAVTMASVRPVVVATDDRFQPDVPAIAAAITPRTRAVVTISPNNPTGAVYDQAVLSQINALCASRGIYHIHDEAYEYFTYGGATHFSPGSMAGAAGHTISLFSLSKAYGFASWRIGYMVIPEELSAAVAKIQDTNLICPPVISQYAAVHALRAGSGYCRQKVRQLAHVRQMALEQLADVADLLTVAPAQGAMYLFANVHTRQRDMDLVRSLVREFGVAVIPGHTFGTGEREGCYLRISYGALEEPTVVEGISRLVRGIRHLVTPIGACTA
jgi:aspartate/methionine/tyrosine aminotransferase